MKTITSGIKLFGVYSLSNAFAKNATVKRKTLQAEDNMKNPLRRL